MTINVLLVEDQKLIRVGLKSLFEGQDDIIVSLEAQSAKEAIEKFRLNKPDIILMTLDFPICQE